MLWMLSSGEKITAKQIAEKLEMNIRTVYRYIDTLTTSGVPIISDTGHNGGYTLLNQFYESPLFFDQEEQTSLLHAATFADGAGYYGGEALTRAISKLSNYTNQEQEKKIAKQFTSMEVINRLNSHTSQSTLQALEQAILDGYSVDIQYKSGREQHSKRKIDPYRIIHWNLNWYVAGFCHFRNDIRSFRVDRIETLVPTENQFKQPEDFSTSADFLNNLLPSIDKKETAVLVLTGSMSALKDICQHWFLENYLQQRTDNQATFLLDKQVLHTYVPSLLIPFGTSIKVMEPQSLKEEMINALSTLIKFYQE
ncbi:YafY family protein [Bacillus sp. LL01]|uniref:helix-turn-helix transcriptional regulator n=1 Tax=Bacillus sp. LL01 TaxID=1665556 RepID=UPI00240FC969|nr:YafY family protein [Bacillus sp. LL01]